MKSYSRLFMALIVVSFLALAGRASAGTLTFGDDSVYFNAAGFSIDPSGQMGNNAPNPTGMTVTWDDATGYLTSIVIDVDTSSYYLSWNSLFINTSGGSPNSANTTWDGWDYMVHSGGNAGATTDVADGLYSVAGTYDYIMGTVFQVQQASGIQSKDLTLVSSSVTGVITSASTLTYDFSSLQIQLSSDFVIGWVSFCGNDSLLSFADGHGPTTSGTVPEPATMVLFGIGIAGLTGWSRRMRK